MLDNRVRDFFAYHARNQIEMVVVYHDNRSRATIRFSNDSICESLVDWRIACGPSIMDCTVYVWGVRRAPHGVLKEPEQWVAKDIVEFVVHPPMSDDVSSGNFLLR